MCLFFRIIECSVQFSDILRDFYDKDDPRNGSVILTHDFILNYFNLLHFPHRRLSITKNRLFMTSSVYLFRKKSVLVEVFNQQLRLLRETGLLQHWISNYVDNRKIKLKPIAQTHFHIENIFGILQICAVMYFISFVVFALEMIGAWYRQIKNVVDSLTY